MLRLIWSFSLILIFFLRVADSATDNERLADIRSLTGQQQFTQALELLDAYLSEHPEDLDAKLLRGVVLTRQGNIDAAIDAFEQLSLEHPSLPEPHNNLAVLHASRGDYEAARLALLRAIELQPSYDTARENLGDLYAKLATTEYEKALSLNPDNSRAEEKTRTLREMIERNDTDSDPPPPPTAEASPEESKGLTSEDVTDTETKACFVIGRLLAEGQAKQAYHWFNERQLSARFTSREESVPVGFRVFIPPLESNAAADVQIVRMRSEGIKDIIRIGSGEFKNGIALGVYATKAAARRRMNSLESRGYMSEIAMRSRVAPVWYVAVALPTSDSSITDFSRQYPDYRIRQVGCE